MKTAKELYPQEYDYCSFYDHQPMLGAFGTIVLQADDQGDSRVLYKQGRKYGYLQFGWGSCSRCDWLQACDNIEEVQELMERVCL